MPVDFAFAIVGIVLFVITSAIFVVKEVKSEPPGHREDLKSFLIHRYIIALILSGCGVAFIFYAARIARGFDGLFEFLFGLFLTAIGLLLALVITIWLVVRKIIRVRRERRGK